MASSVVIWSIIIALFVIAFIGLIYPIIPSVLFIVAGFIVYGFAYSFSDLPWWFWVGQTLFVILLFSADALSNYVGVKKFGGSKAAIWGSTIGLLIGPFVIPVAGILIGPFVGAVVAELLVNRTDFEQSMKVGVGSLVGFLTSVVTKGVIQAVMIIAFILVI
ncbi:MAG: DUF456 domain-containing protein [Caryophanon sp.]|nr:DUF456 domain-containing protein [Caryophanon sp.]